MNLQTAIAAEEAKAETRQRRAGRRRAIDEFENVVVLRPTLENYFPQRFPNVRVDVRGPALKIGIERDGTTYVAGIGEDFFAEALGLLGNPEAPIVFSAEQRFEAYNQTRGHFEPLSDAAFGERVSRLFHECAQACEDEGVDVSALRFKFNTARFLKSVTEKAKAILAVDADYFEVDRSEFLACNNGMVRLSDGTLLPFSSAYRRRSKLAVDFDPQASCPRFQNFLNDALEAEDIDLLQRAMAQAIIAENRAQKIVMMIGGGGTGKSTVIEIFRAVMGQENFAMLRTAQLDSRFEIARYRLASVLCAADVDARFLNCEAAHMLKSLTGNDSVNAELKHSNAVVPLRGNKVVFITANGTLIVRLQGDIEAWRRRLVIIPFNKPKPEKVIVNLAQQIVQTEGPGILNWLLDGLEKLRADEWRISLTNRQQKLVDDLLLESDSINIFLAEEVVKCDDAAITAHSLYESYVNYCSDRGWAAIVNNRFSATVKDQIVRQFGKTARNDIPDPHTGKSQRGWRGLKITGNTTPSLSDTLQFDDPERQAAWDSWEQAN